MLEHKITFRFTGMAADKARLDGSDVTQYTEAARQILALNAFFFTHGVVPNGGALNQTQYYRVWKEADERGSYMDLWIVAIGGGIAARVLGEYALRTLDYTYAHFLKDSVGSILRRKPSSMPLELRREPYFPPQDTGNRPVFDEESEREYHWRQLRERSTLIVPKVARPVGRSATKLSISSELGEIGTIDMTVLQQILADAQAYREQAITAALEGLRHPRMRGAAS
jgi:hypothetical protein